MNKRQTQSHSSHGFTIVEVLITMAVLSVFLFGFFQSYLLVESQRVNVARQARASDIAYSNLRKITTRPGGITCDAATMDLTSPNAATMPGKAVTFTSEPMSVGINTQTVVAFAPNGCGNFATDPIKIVSTVTYGTNGGSVSHASFIQ